MSEQTNGSDVVLEVGCAELPAAFLPDAVAQMTRLAQQHMAVVGLPHRGIRGMGTPRRLVLYMEEVTDETEGMVEEVRGPSENIAFDEDGRPTAAAEGFARSQGMAVEDLQIRTEEKGRYVWAVKRQPGQGAEDALGEVISGVLQEISFPQTMRWGDGSHRFARPVRWILALRGPDVIDVEFAGCASDRYTRGPRFAPECIRVQRASEYMSDLADAGVVVEPERRREIIVRQCAQAAASVGGTAVIPPDLLKEVIYLVEHPQVGVGCIPPEFMNAPRVVVSTAMQTHLRFFPIEQAETDELAPYFLSVINGRKSMLEKVVQGNELVLNARLADAQFFWQEDSRRPLSVYAEELCGVVVGDKMGTLADKAKRLAEILQGLCDDGYIPHDLAGALRRAAHLCKADRVTQMVREFPGLQGRMGEEYARNDGEDEAVCRAIGEHYLPQGPQDPLPETPEGRWLSLVDKADSLVGAFSAGLQVSGSEDPYGLRRAANGILRLMADKSEVTISELFERCAGAYKVGATQQGKLSGQIEDFMARRMRSLLADAGYEHDLIEAVLARGADDIADLWRRIRAADDFLREPESEDLLTAWRRCFNLGQHIEQVTVEPGSFSACAAEGLCSELELLRQEGDRLLQEGRYREFFSRAAAIRPAVDRFLDEVVVMVDDEEARKRRLQLLHSVAEYLSAVADWSHLPG